MRFVSSKHIYAQGRGRGDERREEESEEGAAVAGGEAQGEIQGHFLWQCRALDKHLWSLVGFVCTWVRAWEWVCIRYSGMGSLGWTDDPRMCVCVRPLCAHTFCAVMSEPLPTPIVSWPAASREESASGAESDVSTEPSTTTSANRRAERSVCMCV